METEIQEEICKCGQVFGHHKIQVKFEPKLNCVECGNPIDPNKYKINGNFCEVCSANASERVRESRAINGKKLRSKNLFLNDY